MRQSKNKRLDTLKKIDKKLYDIKVNIIKG